MDERLSKIIEILQSEDGITPEELAARLGVSTRTIRTYINRLNEMLGSHGRIEAKNEFVYRLEGERLLRDEFSHSEGVTGISHALVPTTSAERVTYLLNDLLYRVDWITIDALARILFVSRGTITDDLRQVESELAKFDLSLVRRPRYGIRVEGDEVNRRLCLASQALAAEEGGVCAVVPGGKDYVERVGRCVDDTLGSTDYHLNAFVYQNLLVHIAIAVIRICANQYVPMHPSQLDEIRSLREYSLASSMASRINEEFDICLPDEEIAYIAIHLAGRQQLAEGTVFGAEGELVISEDVWDVVSHMVERVWRAFRFDFSQDLELRMNLARHIVPLVVRLQYHLRMDNPLLSEIKSRYSLAFAMAEEASISLTERYGSVLSEAELGYIALAFALALERQQSGGARKNILIICASGAGSARLLEYHYRREFGDQLNKVVTSDVSSLDDVDFSDIDYVFTTVPLKNRLPVPVREVRFFLDDNEISNVRRVLHSLDRDDEIIGYFGRDLFIDHLSLQTKGEVLDALCERASLARTVPDNLRELVQAREDAFPTSFGNRVAMPHPIEACTSETFVCVGILDRPVLWAPDVEVEVVFLVCVSESADKSLQAFYESLAALLQSDGAIDTLIAQRDFDVLLDLLRSERSRMGGEV